ncbi:CHAT domain-containing protein [Laspinema olomoucense]|uniref:CHAT domain-containing protein n=1 Tax=Laspinema olomoucense TaxID=3231600 RepID=UPI0021BA75D8|nr:CHAT domain-containing protein [Laspinema sp. D3d]MCT7971143.1 CHAT domain-containing protein [Laspinema sp. D3d]
MKLSNIVIGLLSLTISGEGYNELIQQAIEGDIRAAEKAVEISESIGDRSKAIIILANLVSETDPDRAIRLYQSIINQNENNTYNVAQLNLLSLLAKKYQLNEQVLEIIAELQYAISKDSERISFGQTLIELELYQEASIVLSQVTDSNLMSYSLGLKARINEEQGNPELAREKYYQAYLIAESQQDSEALFRWAWGLARVEVQLGNMEEAIALYQDALSHIPNLSLEFNEIEPIYQEFLDILLTDDASQQSLRLAQSVFEQKQFNELSIFFDETCLLSNTTQSYKTSDKIAIYPIVLKNRLIILSVYENIYQIHTVSINQQDFREFASQLNQHIKSKQISLTLYQQLYEWIVKPLELDREVETLIFVVDNQLRNLPLTTMHDGEKYLIANYHIRLSQGLSWSDSTISQHKILGAGVSEARQSFESLPFVENELSTISSIIQNSSILINEKFTLLNFQNQLKKNHYPIIHLATHGKFSSNFEETFLLTWDEQINIRELEQILTINGRPVELLILSACETAVGDEKATLGLAGIANRSGAKFVIASMSEIQDEATQILMTQFYQNLIISGLSISESLHLAQLYLINHPQFSHPFFWSGFVLITG